MWRKGENETDSWRDYDYFSSFVRGEKKGVLMRILDGERSKRHKGNAGHFLTVLSTRLWQSRPEDVSLVYHFRVPELHVLGNVRALWVYYLQNNRFLDERDILFPPFSWLLSTTLPENIISLFSSISAKYIKFSNELQFNPIHVIYPLIIVYAKWNYINQSKNFSTRSTLFIRLFISF